LRLMKISIVRGVVLRFGGIINLVYAQIVSVMIGLLKVVLVV